MSSSASALASASVPGEKRPREPTEKELAAKALLDSVFSTANSKALKDARSKVLETTSNKRQKVTGAQESKDPQSESSASVPASVQAVSTNPFVAAMDDVASSTPVARTANGAVTHANTKSPCLDLFYHAARGYSREDMISAMELAWKENPERTLQVLCHARDAHGDGKGERLVVYYGLMWLRAHKPRTYLANILTFLRLGYFKDLSNLIDMIDAAQENRQPQARNTKKGAALLSYSRVKSSTDKTKKDEVSSAQLASSTSSSKIEVGPLGGSALELGLFAEFLRADACKLKAWRQKKHACKLQNPTTVTVSTDSATDSAMKIDHTGDKQQDAKLDEENADQLLAAWSDEDFVVINEDNDDETSDASAVSLSSAAASSASADTAVADAKEALVEPPARCYISLAGKWAPTEGHKYSHQAKKLAKLLFQKAPSADAGSKVGAGKIDPSDGAAIMKKYRKLLSMLRAQLCVTEKLACANKWDKINFNTVPSKCHQLLKKAFVKHCGERYADYLSGLKKGVGKINVQGLAPHELVKFYMDHPDVDVNDTVEEAWKTLVAKVAEAGTFKSAVAVVDVSSSMSGLPMIVAIAMGLMVSELTECPYNGRVLTFHSTPEWHTIQGTTLKEKVACIAAAPWGGNTNLLQTFDLILDVASKNKVDQQHLPKNLFVFSDMQFDEATGSHWMQTNYEAIKTKYRTAGYAVPGIVFWNLNGQLNKDAPIQCDTPGCALMSGFSASLLNVFLKAPVIAEPPADVPSHLSEEEAAALNPLHPLAIMLSSVQDYAVVVDDTEI